MTERLLDFFILPCCFILFLGCSTVDINSPKFQIKKTLPENEIRVFNDNFENLDSNKWEVESGAVSEKKVDNFKPGSISVEKTGLTLTTASNSFSKISVTSKFYFDGNFDVQIDLRAGMDINPGGVLNVRVGMITTDASKGFMMQIFKRHSYRDGRIYVFSINMPKVKRLNEKISIYENAFDGTFRMIRKDDKMHYFFKRKSDEKWNLIVQNESSNDPFFFAFSVQNFAVSMKSSDSKVPVTVTFDNFKINMANEIIESAI